MTDTSSAARPGGEAHRPRSAEVETWTIEKLVPGGLGMARLPDGRVGFARFTAPGDRISPERVTRKKRHATAETWTLVEGGEHRVEPPCRWLEACGACDFMHLDEDAQRTAKASLVGEALRRTGGFDAAPPVAVVTAGPALGYRGRVRLHVSGDGRLGFHGRGSHDVVEFDECAVCSPGVTAGIVALRNAAAEHAGALAEFSEVEIREAPEGAPLAFHFRRPERAPPGGRGARLVEHLGRQHAVSIAGERRDRGAVQRWPLGGGIVLEAPPGAFTQVNWAVNRLLVTHVVERASELGLRSFCDLFGGAGNFSLPLAGAGLDGVLVEANPLSVGAARASAGRGPGRLEVIADDAAATAARLAADARTFDLVVLDPPREGARELVPDVARLARRAIAYCSCDPVTLARDLAALRARGWRLAEVTAFDMFPQTHHVETVAWMLPAGA